MRLILAGTRSFGAEALRAVSGLGHDVAYVVAPPGDTLANVAQLDMHLPVFESLDHRQVQAARVDLIVGAHTHQYVGRKSRAATKLGALIGHPSLLPRHRGRNSVEWTVRMGDPVAGFTWFWADNGVDTGPIASQDYCLVHPGWTYSQLWRERLFPLGIELLAKTLADLDHGRLIAVPQEPECATWEPALDTIPLHRPELIELGPGPSGLTVESDRGSLRR